MRFNLFKKQRSSEKDTTIVALDIGTEFIKALISRPTESGIEVIGVGRTRQDVSDMHSGAIADITGVSRSCEDALAQAEEQAGVRAQRAVIGIAGELVKGVTETICYKRPNAKRPLDEAEMNVIIQKVHERAQEAAREQIAHETGNEEVEVKLVNSALVSIHIDGYKITDPIGFQGKDVAVQIYTAFAPMVHIGAIERVADELELDLVAIATEPFAVSRSVMGDDVSSNFTAILVDVGGGTTDIAVVNDGGVEGTKMFGIGGRSYTRAIASDMELNYDEAEERKLAIDSAELSREDKKATIDAIRPTLDVWIDGVDLALSEFESVDHLPSKILLCGGGASLKPLVYALGHRNWHEELPFTKKPSVKHIQPSDVVGIDDTTGCITDHTYITALGLLRVGYDTIQGESSGSSVSKKINKMMKI